MRLFYDPEFAAPIGDHIMPMRKFELVAEAIRRDMPEVELVAPPPVSECDLLRVHTPAYVGAIRLGLPRELAESQKFPWSPEIFPSVLRTNGGVLAAGRQALAEGCSGALASGFHHAFSDHGEGFCTFNGLVVALEAMRAEGKIRTGAVLDLDLHFGNGTAALAACRPWMRVLSIYGNDYTGNTAFRDVGTLRHHDGKNHRSVALAPTGGSDRLLLMNALETWLPWLLEDGRPDILLYQAGADPLRDDPYSPLDLGADDLRERDRAVFGFCRENGIPVAWVLAGGYSRDIGKVVAVHAATAREAADLFFP